MADKLAQDAKNLKRLIEDAKSESIRSREDALEELRVELTKEKMEVFTEYEFKWRFTEYEFKNGDKNNLSF